MKVNLKLSIKPRASSIKNILISSITITILFLTSILSADSPKVRPASEMTGPYIDWIKKVADWQLSQSNWNDGRNWRYGTLFAGMIAAYEATKDEKYLNKSRQWAEKFNWQLGWDNSNHADNMTCAQAYLELYFLDEQDTSRYQDFKDQSDAHVALCPQFDCSGTSSNHWWWCDALFMAPPGLVRLSQATGNPIYINFMHMMWEDTQDCLYDTTEHLFFRDTSYFYPGKKNCNDDKIFWSRGNGWVLAGTAQVLRYLPLNDPNRPSYVTLLREMSAKLKNIQQHDGYWYSNLLYPEHYNMPETSGTGLFTYGIAWGMNNGYLDHTTYEPVIQASWEALKAAVHPDGKLGHVQPVGKEPDSSPYDSTNVYGIGAYLLAGSEVQKYFLSKDPSFIDFFTTYDDTGKLKAVWKDGSVNGTDSTITLGNYGDRFMALAYDNSSSPHDSRVDMEFPTTRDWEVNGFISLSILVQGKAGNAEDDIYVELEDASSHIKRVYVNDTNVVDTYKWFEVVFPFSVFDGVDMDQIKRLSIGVGSQIHAATGTGTIRIDTIRLYPTRCSTTYEADSDAVLSYLSGLIGDVRIYNRALDAEEIENPA